MRSRTKHALSVSFLLPGFLLAHLCHAQEAETAAPEAPSESNPEPSRTAELPPAAPRVRASDEETPARGMVPRSVYLRRATEAQEDEPPGSFGRKRGLLLEASTAGFASSALVGGLFVGKQMGKASVGVGIDYGRRHLSSEVASTTDSQGAVLLGARVRVAEAAAGKVDCIVGGEIGYVWSSTTFTSSFRFDDDESKDSAGGIVVAAGPGIRLWIADGLAIGYQTRLRFLRMSGDGRKVSNDPSDDGVSDLEATTIGFDGRFSIFGVF